MILHKDINKGKKSGENKRRRGERGSEVDIKSYRVHTGNVTSELCCQHDSRYDA